MIYAIIAGILAINAGSEKLKGNPIRTLDLILWAIAVLGVFVG